MNADSQGGGPLFRKGFDDIDMLDIGGTSSDGDDSINNISIPSTMETEAETPEPVILKEWLNSDKNLEFHFNAKQYKDSLDTSDDEYSSIYLKYINSIYKIIESLNDLNPKEGNDDMTQEDEDDPIGLITSDSIASKQDRLNAKNIKLNDGFLRLIEHYIAFIEDLKTIEHDEQELERFECVLSILDSLLATHFVADANLKPKYLTQWINRFDPKPAQELVEDIMINSPTPYRHPLFWNTFISKLIIRGLVDQSVNTIQKSGIEELKTTDNEMFLLINDFTSLLQSYHSMTLKNQFGQWKLSCCEFRDIIHKFNSKVQPDNVILLGQIFDLLCILTGLPKTITSYCDEWYEVLTALSLYQIRDDESMYSEYFDIALKEKPPLNIVTQDIFKATEKSFLDVFEGNFLHVLTKIDEVDKGTSAILSRLFELKGLLNSYYNLDGLKPFDQLMRSKTISEYLLTEFAFECLNVHDLVPVGFGLLLNDQIVTSKLSKNHNKTIIENYLPKYNCKTNDDLEWCLTICAKLGLVTTASELYRIYGKKSLKDGYIYEALNMLVNCYNGENFDKTNERGMKEVHYIVWDLIFQDSLLNNRLIKDGLINNIVEHKIDSNFDIHPVIKQCLSPYAILSEFYRAIPSTVPENTLAKDKISKIIHLLEFIHMPKRFYVLLLAQLIPFFLNDNYIFQIPDLIVIIELIDNYELQVTQEDWHKSQELYKYSVEIFKAEDSDISWYDWRLVLHKEGIKTPESIEELIRFIRKLIVTKTGKVYINNL